MFTFSAEIENKSRRTEWTGTGPLPYRAAAGLGAGIH